MSFKTMDDGQVLLYAVSIELQFCTMNIMQPKKKKEEIIDLKQGFGVEKGMTNLNLGLVLPLSSKIFIFLFSITLYVSFCCIFYYISYITIRYPNMIWRLMICVIVCIILYI